MHTKKLKYLSKKLEFNKAKCYYTKYQRQRKEQESMQITDKISLYMKNPYGAEARKKIVSQKLKELRNKAGLTQKEVCEIIDVTPQTYSGYEKGKYEPTMETIVRLAILYNVSTDHILCNWIDEDEESASIIKNETDNGALQQLQEDVERLKQQMEDFVLKTNNV